MVHEYQRSQERSKDIKGFVTDQYLLFIGQDYSEQGAYNFLNQFNIFIGNDIDLVYTGEYLYIITRKSDNFIYDIVLIYTGEHVYLIIRKIDNFTCELSTFFPTADFISNEGQKDGHDQEEEVFVSKDSDSILYVQGWVL